MMVVDLQGVFTVRPNGTKVYELTDPVIHKKKGKRRFRRWTFGRTDRGQKGKRLVCAVCAMLPTIKQQTRQQSSSML